MHQSPSYTIINTFDYNNHYNYNNTVVFIIHTRNTIKMLTNTCINIITFMFSYKI